jgi:hypothetical protein
MLWLEIWMYISLVNIEQIPAVSKHHFLPENDWLIIYSLTSRSRIFHLYGDVDHHCRWRAKNLRLCSAPRAFEQGGIFIAPHLLWDGASVFPVSSERPPHLVASYDAQGGVEDLF